MFDCGTFNGGRRRSRSRSGSAQCRIRDGRARLRLESKTRKTELAFDTAIRHDSSAGVADKGAGEQVSRSIRTKGHGRMPQMDDARSLQQPRQTSSGRVRDPQNRCGPEEGTRAMSRCGASSISDSLIPVDKQKRNLEAFHLIDRRAGGRNHGLRACNRRLPGGLGHRRSQQGRHKRFRSSPISRVSGIGLRTHLRTGRLQCIITLPPTRSKHRSRSRLSLSCVTGDGRSR